MQEFTISIAESLRAGLRRDWRAAKGVPGLIAGRFFELQGGGLAPMRELSNPFAYPVDYPFPQVFEGRDARLYADRDTLYTYDAVYQRTAVDLSTPAGGVAAGIREGGVWHFVDFDNTWALTNGQDFIFRLGAFDHMDFASRPSEIVKVEKRINAVCGHRGRIITGGFLDADMWTSFWQGLLADIKGEVQEELDIWRSQYSSRTVLWSSIGGGDFPFWLFYPDGLPYDHSPSRDRFEQRMKRNELGWAVMPYSGDVLGLAPWGSSVFVFSENGVTRMFLAGATYGFQPLVPVGAAGRGAFAVGRDYVVWVGSDGQLWASTMEGQVAPLGYEEFFLDFLSEEVVVSYEPLFNRFFISGEKDAYTLSILQDGPRLFHSYQQLTSVVNHTRRYGTYEAISLNSSAPHIVSNEFNLGIPGIKTLTSLYLSCDGHAEVAVDYRYTRNDSWVRSDFVPINDEGNAVVMVAGTDFRVVVRAEEWEAFFLDDVQVSFHISDRRAIRGPRHDFE